MPFAVHIVAGGMAAAARPFLVFRHEGQHHGQLAVNQVLQPARHRIIIERKAPDSHVRPQELLDHFPHIVLYAALSRGLVPAGKAPQTGAYLQPVDLDFLDFDSGLLRPAILAPGSLGSQPFALRLRQPLSHPFQKAPGQLPGIAAAALRASIDCQNLHNPLTPFLSFNRAADADISRQLQSASSCSRRIQLSAHCICIFIFCRPYSTVICQYRAFSLSPRKSL